MRAEGKKTSQGAPSTVCTRKTSNWAQYAAEEKLFLQQLRSDPVRNAGQGAIRTTTLREGYPCTLSGRELVR